VVIEPGMDGTRVIPVERSGREQLVRLLFLGNLLSKKGIDDLAAVFAHPELVRRQDYTLTIAGGGDAQVLRRLLTSNPQVHYHGGYTPEQLPALLQAADVGLSPSRFETFHRVTREYLHAGLAVLGSTAFGIPDIVRPGQNGLLFEAGDIEGFRQAVLTVLEDRELLHHLQLGAQQTPIRSTAEEIHELRRAYEATLATAASR
jgi:glycosyltransferase involved in cell wall biosynthesis